MTEETQYAEIIKRLDRIEAGVEKTNGRVTELESFRALHEARSGETRAMIQTQTQSIESIQERMTEVLLACQVSPANLQHAVAKVLDQRQTIEDAAKYRAMKERFGDDPEGSLNRWQSVVSGAQAVGWRLVLTIATISAAGLAGFLAALWRVV